ncbi:tyrosine-type recombinase/integrase [Bremerella sp. T1]|uniref:tyrosine-type recombinase/integrase n=1 Tax=Bremerella sp. TYQ1 TaxID=3119568 RepID=UPI001CCFBF44|nr:site-specific integrase [Bremerella volcania]UBM37386.1 tyrosine-type recombinase/integrase [Bremerella volcania]
MEDIKVLITKREGRPFWMAYYVDPITGKQKFRSTKTTSKRDADKFAGKWEDELRSGRYKAPSKITWEEFTDRFLLEHCAGLAPATSTKYQGAFNRFQTITGIVSLRDATTELISEFQTKVRESGTSEATLACYLRHLKSALRWGVGMGMIHQQPKIKMPKRVKGASIMKGRPISGEEFDRMVAKVPKVCGVDVATDWENLLRGLWLSGLRISEALNLYWEGDKGIVVLLDLKRPMLMIPAEAEKGYKDRLLPITPDFVEFLQKTPESQRRGRVFPLRRRDNVPMTCVFGIGKRISEIGEAAGVKVKDTGKVRTLEDGTEEPIVKYASAHDLRRSFGHRWSRKVMPAVLQALMRHESINTTMMFYVGQEAESVADAVWEAARMNDSMNASPDGTNSGDSETPENVSK